MKPQKQEPKSETNGATDPFPEIVIEAQRLFLEFEQLRTKISETESVAEDAQQKYSEALLGNFDLTSDKDVIKIETLCARIRLASDRLPALQENFRPLEKELNAASSKAANHLNYMCEEAARGHQEIAAQAIVSHFGSLQDARSASSETPGATHWLAKRIHGTYYDGASMKLVLQLAPEIIAELQMLRRKLGGSIPTAAEMNE